LLKKLFYSLSQLSFRLKLLFYSKALEALALLGELVPGIAVLKSFEVNRKRAAKVSEITARQTVGVCVYIASSGRTSSLSRVCSSGIMVSVSLRASKHAFGS